MNWRQVPSAESASIVNTSRRTRDDSRPAAVLFLAALRCKWMRKSRSIEGEKTMLGTVVVVLIVLWALGLIGGYAAGGLIHILIVIAVVVLALRLLSGRKLL